MDSTNGKPTPASLMGQGSWLPGQCSPSHLGSLEAARWTERRGLRQTEQLARPAMDELVPRASGGLAGSAACIACGDGRYEI